MLGSVFEMMGLFTPLALIAFIGAFAAHIPMKSVQLI